MKSSIKIHTGMLFILTLLSFFGLIFILYQLKTDFVDALNIDDSAFDGEDLLFVLGHFVNLILYLYSIIYIFGHLHKYATFKILSVSTLILAIISLLSLGGEKVMFDEIAREYRLGIEVSEVNVLAAAYMVNIAFSILMFLFLLKVARRTDLEDAADSFSDERVFTIAQYMGMLSGVLGIHFTFTLINLQIFADKIWIYIPFYLLFLIPYGLSVLYWLSLKTRKKVSEWYDEKQFQDVLKASLTTLLLSVPLLALFLLVEVPDSFYWFLYYAFLVLLVFSGSTLYYFKVRG